MTTKNFVDVSHTLSEPFYIVLVNIKQTLEARHVQCEKIPLEPGVDLKFVAISYRWGELPETVIPTVDYNAHITSFDIEDFITLCEMISQEPELGTMEYVWVDAICVDQMNEARKKETIYRMSDIYDQANYILAVPDLHLAYLKKNPSNRESIELMQQNALLIYHIMQQNYQELHELDDTTLNDWEVPKENRQDMANFVLDFKPEDVECNYLLNQLGITANHYATYWENYNCWAPDKIVTDIFSTEGTKPERVEEPTPFYESLKRRFRGIKSVFMPQQKLYKPRSTYDEKGDDQYRLQQLVIMLQVNKWNSRLRERNNIVNNAISFFQYLVDDWSDRVWVISEYHISKKKQKLKYWFISFFEYEEESFEGKPFFEVCFPNAGDPVMDDSNDPNKDLKKKLEYSSTQRLMRHGLEFTNRIKNTLIERNFLSLMLRTNASRNPDRFNAVLPLSERYGQYLKDKDTISSWKISDMISVRMRMRLWFKTEENLLLLCALWGEAQRQVMLPSFDCVNVAEVLNETYQAFGEWDLSGPVEQYNFDLQADPPVVLLVDANDDPTPASSLRYRMYLQPKLFEWQNIYYDETETFISFISKTTWKELELDPYDDALTYVQIPLLCKKSENTTGNQYRIALVGSMDRNRWIAVGRNFVHGDRHYPQRKDSHHTKGELELRQNTDSMRFCVY